MAIEVFDDVFDINYANHIWGFVYNSRFLIGWEDDSIPEHSPFNHMHSNYNDDDINNLGIISKLLKTPAAKYMEGRQLFKAVVNISSPGQTYFDHTHPDDWSGSTIKKSPKVLLYYPNLEWKREWGGETMFYTKDNKEIERAVEYRPNRLIVFDGEHSHRVGTPTAHSPYFRFSLSMFFGKDKITSNTINEYKHSPDYNEGHDLLASQQREMFEESNDIWRDD